MNTRFSMVLVGIDTEFGEALAASVERDLRAHEHLMSRFDPNSPVSELNRGAFTTIKPPAELWNILTACRDFWQRTGGAFDITLWPLQQTWREHLKRGLTPDARDLEEAAGRTGFHRLHLDPDSHAVRFLSPGMSIDLGGIGKGFALECIAADLRKQGVEKAFLSFGESSIVVLGSHPHGEAWPVGIAHMFDEMQTVHTFHLRDASLSSSGTAPSNRMAGGEVCGQIIHPATRRPIEGYRTLSVAGPSAIEAEVLSTALLVTPQRERASLLSAFSARSAVEVVYYPNTGHPSTGDFVPQIQWSYGL
jgi:thiamine biosynthesis lipoprotein